MKKIPKLRFPKFNDEWEKKKLESKVNFIASGKSKIKVENGKYKLYGSTGPIGFVDTIDYEGKYILVARVGANAGTVYKVDDKCGISDNTLVIECKEDVNYIFLYNKIKQYNLNKLIFGSGQPLITGGQLKDLKFCFPSLPEQEKIASFLSKVDESIEILEEEKELWEKYKKGMMQKIFSQKLRFKDENGNDYPEWEEKRIGDLTKFHQQGYYTKDSYNLNNPYYLLSGANIKKHKIDLANCPKINASAKDFETFKVKKGDILLIRSGNVGDYAIAYEEKNIIFGSYLIKFNLNSQIIINEFFGYFYQSESKERQLKMIIQSSANVNINAENIKSLKITLPTLLEQEKIANFLSSIDEKIEIIEKELEGVKEFKKGLLQQMFV
ncbi:restriction endonuclease subunit S (plasmid) [Cetobacterium somerae]|uniref:restriction endonuclease subunit S n=1 Tax=Cetobacterium somerae TaxID=188913 RepID=UPI002E7ACF05|nr:restriction endonuclease subunit S [Cetobacterium somerae]WVJ03175.1 restriction endonuclease subunit S [Cetobacterium somerae]